MELKEQVESLQKDIAQLTQVMAEAAKKGLEAEVKELSDKLTDVQKELAERKIQFEAQSVKSAPTIDAKAKAVAMDELFIAKYLCTNKDTGVLDNHKWDKVKSAYSDTIKAFGDVDAVGTTAGSGVTGTDNFIPVGFSSQFQEEIFQALQVAGLFGRINMPAADYRLPFAPGRLIAAAATEGGTVTKSKPGDEQITFTAKKLMSIVELTDELDQDAFIPVLNLFRKQLINGFALAQDTMALNGDKGTLGSSMQIYDASLNAADCRSLVNGLRAHAMYKSTKVDCSSGKCNVANIRKLRAAMGKYGVSPSELAVIVSIADYNTLLTDTNIQTIYQYGQNAVLLKGELGRVDGIPIIVSELVPDRSNSADTADAPGGVLNTGVCDIGTVANNDYSTFALVNKNGFMWGDRKEFALEMWRNPLNQTNNLIGTQRLDFEKVTGTASTPSAIGYNYAN